jgi:Uma2 family endonuclease
MAKAETDRKAPVEQMTYEEFLAWCDEDTWAEWVYGKVEIMTPAAERHQDLMRFLLGILDLFIQSLGLGRVLCAPFQMKTGPDLPGREPDLLYVARERMSQLRSTYLEGPADLVIEITSPESRLRDRGEKFAEYEAGGVREYWIIDPDARRVDFFRLDPEGRYQRFGPDPDGIYRAAAVPGFWIRPDWLWQDPLPASLGVLRELGVIPPAAPTP